MTFDHTLNRLPIKFVDEAERDTVIAKYIADHKDEFREWYMPLQVGKHAIPARTFPKFNDRPESLLDETSGKRKWDLTLSKVMPSLTGKAVCDMGCNIGIFSLEVAKLGVKSVDGFDRGVDIVQPNNHHLGTQNVAQQAYFVRNVYEAYNGVRYDQVQFHTADLMEIDFTQHRYDVFMALCVLYHLGADRMEEIIQQVSEHTPEIILQANNGHGGDLGQLSSLENHVRLLTKYGYTVEKTVMGPVGYPHPVVYAKKDFKGGMINND